MFIHGKLFLTHHSIMLDETRSLIQKSLRRKEWVLALQAAKELLGYEKDQLPWKSLVTYLLEDHCLSDTDVLMVIYKAYEDGSRDAKYRCVELLMQCDTCRVAACLPVIALDSPYEPKHWDEDIEVRDSVMGLVIHENKQINTDILLEHLLRAWTASNPDGVITYMKLCTMVAEHEKRVLTPKGKEFLITSCGKIRKLHFGLVVLSALYKNTDDATMRGYLAACHRLATIPEVCIRLILFAPLTRLMFADKVSHSTTNKKLGRVDWKTVRRLTYMPPWAVDKHTFRGKFGRGTKSILKKRPQGMTEEQYEEFHGAREKRGLDSFFDEGVKCTKEALEENPFWERTKELYFLQPQKQQKTQAMTQQFYTVLKSKFPEMFQSTKSVFFDYSGKSNGNLFGPPKKKTTETAQTNIQEFFKPAAAASSPSVQVRQVTTSSDEPDKVARTSSSKRRYSDERDSPEKAARTTSRRKNSDVIDSPDKTIPTTSSRKYRDAIDSPEKAAPKTSKKRYSEMSDSAEMAAPTTSRRRISDMSDSTEMPALSTSKRKHSDVSDQAENKDEGLSRAQKRRRKEKERRKSEYETENIKGSRKVHGVMAGGFAEAAKRLGCPTNLPEKLFSEDDEIMSPQPSSSKVNRSFSFSGEESSLDAHNFGSPLGSPMASYLSGAEARPSTSRSKYADTSLESNGLDGDFLNGLENEFEDDMPNIFEGETVKEEKAISQEEEEEMEESEDEQTVKEEADEDDDEENQFMAFRGPLLQLPTSAGKVYTCADIEANKVIKGPYRNKTVMNTSMFLNQVMKDVIDDPHTLEFESEPPYITFQLMRGHGASMEITERDFTDCISQADIKDAEFLTRDCLGIVQLHKLQPQQIRKLPISIWGHFLFRFALNVGDSGLYNAITDSKLSFVYGIDITEQRGPISEDPDLLKIMFSKAPRKNLCEAIIEKIKRKKMELLRIVSKPINYATMDRLAREYGVSYDRLLFIERIKKARQLVAKL